MIPELHRPIAVDRIGSDGLDVLVEASAAECAALAGRLSLPGVLALSCSFQLRRDDTGTLLVHGTLAARVVQSCVVSLEDFPVTIEERFTVRCVPAEDESEDIDPDAPDEITYSEGSLDLGEAAAQQLALALDPYPRAPNAALPDIEDQPAVRPFDALATLRRH